jgi:hypothetical protein
MRNCHAATRDYETLILIKMHQAMASGRRGNNKMNSLKMKKRIDAVEAWSEEVS